MTARGSRRWPALLGAAVWLALPAVPAGAEDVFVHGVIQTPDGENPLAHNRTVSHIRVIVGDIDPLFPDVDIQYTDANGNFAGFFADVVGNPDIRVDVEYVGELPDGKFVSIYADTTAFDPVKDEELVEMPECANPCELGVVHVRDTRANAVREVANAVWNLKSSYVDWVVPKDLRVNALGTVGEDTSVSQDDIIVNRQHYDDPGPLASNGKLSVFHHEPFHWAGLNSHGRPPSIAACPRGTNHDFDQETCETIAFWEGSAEYFAAQSFLPDVDAHTEALPADVWRGKFGPDPTSGSDNSGEIVEGAIWNLLDALGDFPGFLRLTIGNDISAGGDSIPDSIREYRDLLRVSGGPMVSFLDAAAVNGIVYTRGKITGFEEGPPGGGTPDAGNFEIFENVAYLRGKVNPTILALSEAELRLESTDSTIDPTHKTVGTKRARDGFGDSFNGFKLAPAKPFGGNLDWDTTAEADGEYDLVVVLTNTDGWRDTLRPDFTNDPEPTLDTNEKWLKRLGTWYDRGAPRPSGDDEGKIVIDNTAPVVSNCSPQ